MDAQKKVRAGHRTAFTKTLNDLNGLLNAEEEVDKDQVAINFELLEEKMADLNESSARVLDTVLQNPGENAEALYDSESAATDEYKKRFLLARRKVNSLLKVPEPPRTTAANVVVVPEVKKKTLKLQKIEIVKFSGNVRDWLQFWNQFRKIHEDPDVDEEDKFQHLIQSMVHGSRAFEIVNSYPPTRENYNKVITSLTNRFGKPDLQVEVYVRELLSLVLNNALRGKEKASLASLYDKLETYIRALETLGVTTEKCAAMLLPLVESALPEEALRTWQRSAKASEAKEAKDRITNLLKFVGEEVEHEERINLAVAGFSLNKTNEKSKSAHEKTKNTQVTPTATELLTTKPEKGVVCVFCKEGHESQDCFKARKMSLKERRDIVKDSNCCFNCLKGGHSYKRCKTRLKCPWCSRKHVLLMCPENPKSRGNEVDSENSPVMEHNLASHVDMPEVYLQTLCVNIVNGEKRCAVRALIDTGSQQSYLRTAVVDKVGYQPVGTRDIRHMLFGGVKTQTQSHNVYLTHIRSATGHYACNFSVMNQDTICNGISSIKVENWIGELKSEGIILSDVGKMDDPIDLLIGADVAGKLLTGRKHDLKNGLTAVETHLGWTVMGKCVDVKSCVNVDSVLHVNSSIIEESNVSDLWRLDVLGIEEPAQQKTKLERELAVEQKFNDTTIVNEQGRYEVILPWITDHAPLSSNKNVAERRLKSTLSNLKRRGLLSEYTDVFKEWERDGIIERVPDDERDNFAHYLPHHPVVKMSSSTTKIRPVFDASAHEKDYPSLNQCLEKGSNLIELIPAIILKFRKGKKGAIADIKRAFLHIGVAPQERDYLRFLWEEDGKIIEYRHTRVVFGVISSSFLLGATIRLHLKKVSDGEYSIDVTPETVEKMKDCFYSDNCVTSVDSDEEQQRFSSEASRIMQSADFELRGWEFTGDNDCCITNVLGFLWNKRLDTLSVNISFCKELVIERCTKRLILSVAHQLFDPVGFTCPVSLYPKLLLQKIWRDNLNWDEEVSDEIKTEFLKWLKDLPTVGDIKIPRRIGNATQSAHISFHAFSDASGLAYASAVFIRVEVNGTVQVQLIGAKSRVAPTKGTTIPRLELLAAGITARLAVSLINALKFSDPEIIYWSDSTTVLSWINREAQWNTFVYNRVKEIRELTSSATWRYVPSSQNPADLPSRGCTPSQLAESAWWEGPDWLRMPREKWPSNEFNVEEQIVAQELKKSALKTSNLINKSCLDLHSYCRYFSRYERIVRLIAWINRYLANLREKIFENKRLEKNLSCEELKDAEIKLLMLVQREMFKDESDSKLKSLSVFKDEHGLMRVRTKIFYRNDTENFRCPIVLDSNHLIVQRIIEQEHFDSGHAGVQTMLCTLRERFWILSARRKIRSVVSKCVRCKRFDVKRMEAAAAPLPVDRVRDAAVFEIIGIDLAGPLYLRDGSKAWICLFTCAVYRAVHLELLSSLSTMCFLESFRRFIARRGRPSVVFTDNGTNFVGAEGNFKELNWDRIAEYSTAKRIVWNFNPPSAAWWGGWWERLVGLMKQLLRRILGKASLDYENLSTVLCDCEAVLNARPLTYISNDCDDLGTLTPNMFLHEVREVGTPDFDNIAAVNLREKSNYNQKLREDLRRRFRSEYLGQLREAAKLVNQRELTVGDIVFVGSDGQKRVNWPLGRIVAVFKGKDGNARVYRIKTANGELTRPVQRLFPLEIDCNFGNQNDVCKEIVSKQAAKLKVSSKVDEIKRKNKSPNKSTLDNKTESPYVTKSGREVKKRRF